MLFSLLFKMYGICLVYWALCVQSQFISMKITVNISIISSGLVIIGWPYVKNWINILKETNYYSGIKYTHAGAIMIKHAETRKVGERENLPWLQMTNLKTSGSIFFSVEPWRSLLQQLIPQHVVCFVRFLDVRQHKFVTEWKITTSSVPGIRSATFSMGGHDPGILGLPYSHVYRLHFSSK